MVNVKEDMTGWIMSEHGVPDSRLTIICQGEDYIELKSGCHKARWWCQCNCGSEPFLALQSNIKKKNGTRSCGCILQEMMPKIAKDSRTNHKTNKYDLTLYDYGVGWTTNTNAEFYFDLEDYEKIKDYCWSESVNTRGYHSLVAYDRETQKEITMFHLIVGKNHDHKNRNALDNRKENLRPTTRTENAQNHSLRKDNTSGISGVNWDKKGMCWVSRIFINKKETYLGSFTNKRDAIISRLMAEQKYYKEFAPQRHLFKEYDIE